MMKKNLDVLHYPVEQNTDQWLDLRRGRFTASSIKNLLAAKTTKSYQDEVTRVAFEIMTGQRAEEGFTSSWMERGKELEQEALDNYEVTSFVTVQPPGFFAVGEYMGASPDGLVGDDGLVEVKCPKWNTMMGYLQFKKLPKIYEAQVQFQLFCSERQWCDFVAYHPALPLLVVRVERNDEFIDEILAEVEKAIAGAFKIIEKINS